MRIKQITIDNFKVFQRPTTIVFPKGGGQQNIFLIGGSNGSGKTTIVEALSLCLYGGKTKQIFESINKNERERGNCGVSFELIFEKDDGVEIGVKRMWQTNGVTVNQPKAGDLEEKLIINKNGERIKVVNKTKWQEYINATIPEGISDFFFFNGEKIERMAEDEDSSVQLKSSIETILGLKVLRKLVEDLDQVQRRVKKESTDISDKELKKEQADLDLLQEQFGKLKTKRKELLEKIDEVEQKKKDIREQFHKIFGFSPEAREKLDHYKQKQVNRKVELGEINKAIGNYANETLPVTLLIDYFPKIEKQIILEEEIKQKEVLQKERQVLAKKIVESIYKNNICPIGKETVEEKDKKDLIKIISKSIGDENKTKTILLGLSRSQTQNLNSVMHSIKRATVDNIVPLLQKRNNLYQRIGKGKKEIENIELQEAEVQDFEAMLDELQDQENLLGRKKNALDQIEDNIVNKKQEIENKTKDINNLYQKYEQTQSTKKLLRKASGAKDVLEEYIKTLREKKLKDLKRNIFKMYKSLAYKSELMKDIYIEPKTYTVSIVDQQGREIEKKKLSAGEKEIYAISLLWGLAETSTYNLPIIIDTPLARLDQAHRSQIVKNYLPKAGKQVIILSTDTEITEQYYNELKPHIDCSYHLNFDKKRQWSTIEKGYFWE